MKTPVLSIITVTYNALSDLKKTVASVAEQTYTAIEYIVVDGASTDGTASYIANNRAVVTHFLSEPDNGLYDAMNKAMRMVTGDYVCFLNAGDTFVDAHLLTRLCATLPADLVPDILYGQTQLVDNQGHYIGMRRLSAPNTLTWKSFQQGMLVCHQSFWVHRDKIVPYDLRYRYSADFDWCIRIMKQSTYMFNTHLTLVSYLHEGLTTQHHRASLLERFQIMCKHYGCLSTCAYHAWFVLRALLKIN